MNKPLLLKGRKAYSENSHFPCVYLRSLFLVLACWLFGTSDSTAQQWNILANEQAIASAASNYTNITLVNEGGATVPYVIYSESGVAKVKKQQNGSWAQVGENISAGTANYTRIYADEIGNIYITYVDAANGNKLAVKKYNQTSGDWEPLNNNSINLYVSLGSVSINNISQYNSSARSAMAFDAGNTPYIVFADGAGQTAYVKKFNGVIWETVGAGPVSAIQRAVGVGIALDETNVPHVVYANQASATSTTGSLALYRYINNMWESVAVPSPIPGGSSTSGATGGIRHTCIASAVNGNLAIAYFNTGNSNRATVIMYNTTAGTWRYSAALSSRDATYISLTRDNAGNLYASFIDAISTAFRNAGRVMKQAAGATSWTEVKDPSVATGIDEPVSNLSFAIGSDASRPFIVYTKTNSGGVSTPVVRMFSQAIITKPVTNITATSATAAAEITYDGGSPVTERGFVYGKNSNPTMADNKVADAAGGTGSFTASFTGLTDYTIYHLRAYATNSSGTTYGNNVLFSTPSLPDDVVTTPKQVEYLNRGVVAVRASASKVYVGWRLLGTDPADIAFNVYRDGVKLNDSPITNSTNFEDNTATDDGTYLVKPVLNGNEGAPSAPAAVWAKNQLSVPLQIPAGGITPDGDSYTYSANDVSVGDVDGDGEYEIFLKWEPSKKNDNAGGYSGNQIFDCYKLDGTHLWRINLGHNMPAGPHYNHLMVYDFDGDGKAEVILKTADGTVDGTGKVIGDATVDYRSTSGWVHQGPEFLTVFNGLTGTAMSTVNYEPARGNISDWGDNYGNRADRFVSAVAYLDGARPSLIVGRGYYDKLVRAAYDWRDGKLTLRWIFDSKESGNETYSSQGNHQMTIGDVDGDGKDEVLNGSSAINDNGRRLWSNGYGHGDALHLSDMDPERPGQEMWICLESPSSYNGLGLRLNDAKTGETIWGVPTTGDVGRALAADIDPNHKGYEMWGSTGSLYNAKGEQISTNRPSNGSQAVNHAVWWDGDLSRELLDGTIMDKWNPNTNSLNRLFTIYQAAPVSSNNDTKKNPGLTADLFGDWREEIILRRSDNTALILFTTTIPTEHRIYTLMHDPQYRAAIAWQNSGYNQPPHPGFYLGNDMAPAPVPNIKVTDIVPPAVTSIKQQTPITTEITNATSVTYLVDFSEDVTGVDVSDFTLTATGTVAGQVASVSAGSGTSVEVTVINISGDGTLRLDVNSSNSTISDNANNPLTGSFTTGEVYSFDHTAPTLTSVIIASSHANAAWAKEGDFVILNFTSSEIIAAPEVTIAGKPVIATSLGNNQYSATLQLTSADAEGVVAFAIQFKDIPGNAGTQVTNTTNGGLVTYDRTKPVFANASVNKPILPVPNHKMEDIQVNYEIDDKSSVSVVVSVTSNEPEYGLGDGDIGPDWEILGERQVRLRAERSGKGKGRVYTITITATDIVGNTSTQTLTVAVPLNHNIQSPMAARKANEEVMGPKGFLITAFPNPASDYFNLHFQSSSVLPIKVIITDSAGRIIEEKSEIAASSKLMVGHTYQPGVYFVQAIQGNEKITLKLVK